MVVIPIPKSKKVIKFFIKFDCGLILSLLCQIKQSSYVKGGTHPYFHACYGKILHNKAAAADLRGGLFESAWLSKKNWLLQPTRLSFPVG